MAVVAMLFAANCGGGGGNSNPPPPLVVIEANDQLIDVGDRYLLSAADSTDPNGSDNELEFIWRIIDGGIVETTDFDDHCREDFDEICDSNDDDMCSNDPDTFCAVDSDCPELGTCNLNTGTTSEDCTVGICGLGEGNEGVEATFLANVAGPFTVRCTALGSDSNGTGTVVLDTFPSLFLTDSILQFGGTEGSFLGAVADADEYAATAFQGTSDPSSGNLVVIDSSINVVRTFDLLTGEIVNTFAETDRFVDVPRAIAFNPDNLRLYVADASGKVLIFDGETGLLIRQFADVGPGPVAMEFSPVTGDLVVAYGAGTAGLRAFSADGTDLGVLGETDLASDDPVDLAFFGEDEDNDLLIADAGGFVVRCDSDGDDCGSFSTQADSMLDPGSPSAVAVNPSAEYTDHDVMIADPMGQRVIACRSNGNGCATFGDTADGDVVSDYSDVFFSPGVVPSTTTTTTTTTTLRN